MSNSKLVEDINSRAHWILKPQITALHKQIKELKEDFAIITKEYIDDRVRLDSKIKTLNNKINQLHGSLLFSHYKMLRLQAGYQFTGFEGPSCPGCTYINGKFIESCQLHKRIDEAWTEVERLNI